MHGLYCRGRLILLIIISFASILTFWAGCGILPDSTITPHALRCEYRVTPIDVDTANPRLSWELHSNARGQVQTAYQILVASSQEALEDNNGDLWDSGMVDSDSSVHIVYDGRELDSRAWAFWKVRVWDADGRASDWSEPAFWEMGLLEPDDWKAEWIGYDCDTAPMLRREFTLDRNIERAQVYISGLGYYELSINGERVGRHVLDPAQTDYEERVFYEVYDVTPLVETGSNACGVILGNGWYNQNVVNEAKYGWGDVVYGEPRVIMQLMVSYSDGSSEIIATDCSWKGSSGPILSNNVYAGETYDARRELPGWDMPDYNDSEWEPVSIADPPGGVLESEKLPPIKKMKSFGPAAMTNPAEGVYVFDMGQNFAGWARLTVEADAGTAIQLRFAEELDDSGMIDPGSTGVGAIHVVQTEKYICKGQGVETWEPQFTYHGFRYIEMTGYPGTPSTQNIEGVVVHTAVEKTGLFTCSDDMLNRIYNTALWTQISNLHGLPEDCPAREKCGWLGDAHVTAEMTIHNYDMAQFWTKYVGDIETNRRSRNGIVEDIAPGKRQEPGEHPDWGSAFIQIPWYMYLYYGDTSVAREHYPGMKEFITHVEGLARDYIVYDGYGDWCPPGGARPVETPVELTSTAYFYFDAMIMAKLAALFGKTDDTSYYNGLAERIRTAYNGKFYDSQLKTYGSQTGDCFSLYLGLVPKGDEQAVANSIVRDIEERHDGHHSTGVTGSLHLYWALGHYGHGDTAYKLLRNTTYPSIGYLFSLGATTLWESWGVRRGSLNHPMQGGFTVWFYQGICGIYPDPEIPGYKHTIFRPPVTGPLTYAEARIRSPYGEIRSSWEKTPDTFTWEVTVPVNTTATVYLPDENESDITESDMPLESSGDIRITGHEDGTTVVQIGSGMYRFVCGTGNRAD